MGDTGEERVIKSNCRGCHGGCRVLVHVKDGRITKIEGDPDFPTNHGAIADPPAPVHVAIIPIAVLLHFLNKRVNGIDSGHCSNKQRKKCKQDNLYSECPKAIKIESLQKLIASGDGHPTALG